MSEAVIVALITGGLALAGSFLTAFQSSRLTAYKIEELRSDLAALSERVNKHNDLVERMAIVEQSVKSAHKRLDGLRRNGRAGRGGKGQ